MQRKLRLKVLYWPLFASLCIVLLLMRWEPLMTWVRPAIAPWLGEGTAELANRVVATPEGRADDLPDNRLTAPWAMRPTAPWAIRPAAPRPVRPVPQRPVDASLMARGEVEHPLLAAELPQRDEVGPRTGRSNGSSLADLAESLQHRSGWDEPPLAVDGPLLAPQMPADHELAGLDLRQLAGGSLDRPAGTVSRRKVNAILASMGSGQSRAITESVADAVESMDWYRDNWSQLLDTDHAEGGVNRAFVGDQWDSRFGNLDNRWAATESGSWQATEGQRAIRSRHGLGGGWPDVPQLFADLKSVAAVARRPLDGGMRISFAANRSNPLDFDDWQQRVNTELLQLRRLPSISSPESAEILATLETLADEGYLAAEAISDRPTQIVCLRASHALQRRVAVWASVYRATQAPVLFVGDLDSRSDRELIRQVLTEVQSQTHTSDDPAGWQTYLLLSDLSSANESNEETWRRLIAQRFLSRVDWQGLSQCQREWLERDSVLQLASLVRRWAVTPIDYAALLGQLERQESDTIDLGAIDVARAAQTLRFASSPEAVAVSEQLNTLYRNANVRLAVSGDLIQRLIPEVDTRVQPVRQQILGADVRGQSVVDSAVSVQLVPSSDSWKLQLVTQGNLVAQTASRNGPVSIRNGSHADFQSVTPIEISLQGADTGQTTVGVQSQTRVRGIDTDFDAIPLFSTLIREIAHSRYQSLAPTAKQIQDGQIRRQVGQEVDQQLQRQLDAVADKYSAHLAGPLGALGLNPMVMDMQTSEQRLTARYRVGGDWQLAAFTPRPRAPGNSLLSLQMHQSVLNNTLETALPAGESVTIAQLIDEMRQRFALPDDVRWADDQDEELAQETHIHFAATRPITVEIENDTLWVTLRVMRLNGPGKLDLRRFVVRAAYKVELDGLNAQLVRDGHLRISGPGMSMRDRLPIRAIFNKVFSTNRPLPLSPAGLLQHDAMQGLAITQFDLRDGWLGLAIGPAARDRVATVEAGMK